MSLTEKLEKLNKIIKSIKNNPNRDFTKDYFTTKIEIKDRLVEEFEELYLIKVGSENNENILNQINLKNIEFKKLVEQFDNLVAQRLKVNLHEENQILIQEMALASDKVLDVFCKLFPVEYNGCPEKLEQTIRILQAIKDTVSHPDNQKQITTLIRLKLIGKASDALPENTNTIDEIINELKLACKGQTTRQLITKLESTAYTDKKVYIQDLQNLSQSMLSAYSSEGVRKDTALCYVMDDITKNIKKNFIHNKVMVAAMNQNFASIDDIIHRFEAIQIDRDASILHYRKNQNKRYNKNWNKNNYNSNSNNKYKNSEKNGPRGHSQGQSYHNKNKNKQNCRMITGNEQTPREDASAGVSQPN